MVAAVRATNITGGFLHGMPRRKGCTWLDAYPLNRRPPLTRLLERSVYYPASGTDWRPMQYLHPHFGSLYKTVSEHWRTTLRVARWVCDRHGLLTGTG